MNLSQLAITINQYSLLHLKHKHYSKSHKLKSNLNITILNLQKMHCPIANSFNYTSTLCACKPGFLYNATRNICSPFADDGEILVGTGVDYSINLPESILPFDSIKKYTQSQRAFVGATLVMIVTWLMFCFLVRFGSVGDGRTYWFKVRWMISRLDMCFATRHWLVSLFYI